MVRWWLFQSFPRSPIVDFVTEQQTAGDFGDGFKGVKGELGVPDLELLPSKMVSLSLELLAELVDVAELLGCGLGRR